ARYFRDGDIDRYAGHAGIYEAVRNYDRELFERQTSNFVEKGLEGELDAEPGDTVLELGAGTSKLSGELEERGYTAVSMDLNEKPQRIAREKDRSSEQVIADADVAAGRELGKTPFLPFQDGSIDYVVAPRVMHLLDSPHLLEDMYRVASGGIAFDFFRDERKRRLARWFMEGESAVHSEEDITDYLERIEGVETSDYSLETDFGGAFNWHIAAEAFDDALEYRTGRETGTFSRTLQTAEEYLEDTVGYAFLEKN
ncbi:MAG: class I SAM-dependent methyltransferase, partial [Candidatus Nanohaloarchaea archaeon]